MGKLQHRAKTERTIVPSIALLIATWKSMTRSKACIDRPCDVCGVIAATKPWLWDEAWPTLEPLMLCANCQDSANEWDDYVETETGRRRAVYPTAPVTVGTGRAAWKRRPTPPACRCAGRAAVGDRLTERAAAGKSVLYECDHCGLWWIDTGEIHFALGMMIAMGHVYGQRKS